MTIGDFTDRESATLDALLATFAPPDADRSIAGEALRTALRRLAPHRLAKIRTLIGMLDGPLLTFALSGRWQSFASLDLRSRERVLLAMADSRLAQLRMGFQVFKRLCGFVTYAATDEAGANPLWPSIGYPGSRSDIRTISDLTVVEAAGDIDCDVVVVGSGAGGGVAAALFSQAGRRVVVLEAGPAPDTIASMQREADAFGSLYLESGLCATDDLSISVLAGSCIGGGTTVNWCTSLRLTDKVARQWSEASGGIDFSTSLAGPYQAVSERLGITTTHLHNENNAALLRGARSLGWPHSEIPRNASHCGDGCGYCGFGCAYGNKRSTAQTYLRDAVAAGASIVAGARVERIIIKNRRAAGVEATLTDGRQMHVRASTVVLGAGSLRSPGILRRSGVESPHLGKHLRLHPTTAIFAEFDEPVEMWHGPMQTIVCDKFEDIDDGYGAKFEAVPAHPGLAASAIAWRSQESHAAVMARLRNAAALIVLTRDRGEGSVSDDGRDDVRYRVDSFDGSHMLAALAGLVRLAFSAGARSVTTLHTDPIELERRRASDKNLTSFARTLHARGVAPNRLAVYSAHQMGTCRMHRDPAQGVVDETGRVHGVEGLIVVDASVFPLSSSVNPMLTIMALAHRSATQNLSA
ncbi:MAG TPA: GMC family oxidoreductase [Candidatus Eremiobacteraceae bacterium]|nr:GMC family oxidoreductase [Candidatus Eremiobacteraceae bacterium]